VRNQYGNRSPSLAFGAARPYGELVKVRGFRSSQLRRGKAGITNAVAAGSNAVNGIKGVGR